MGTVTADIIPTPLVFKNVFRTEIKRISIPNVKDIETSNNG